MGRIDETLEQRRTLAGMKTSSDTGSSAAMNTSHPVEKPFEELFMLHWMPIYRVLLRLVGDPAEAEDLALETFMRLYQQPPTAPGSNLGAWLRRVATNLGLTAIRSQQRRERYELAAGVGALVTAADNRPPEVLAEEEQRRAIRLALGSMNPRLATLLEMRYSGMAYREIASALGVSPASIGPMLLRAEREFEKRIRALEREES